jgi:hypothetical protein
MTDDSDDLIEQARTKLKAAFKEAKGKPDVQAQIQQQLNDLTDNQEELALANLQQEADILKGLSDQLDQAIAAIKNDIDNFLIGDLTKIKDKMAARAATLIGGI